MIFGEKDKRGEFGVWRWVMGEGRWVKGVGSWELSVTVAVLRFTIEYFPFMNLNLLLRNPTYTNLYDLYG